MFTGIVEVIGEINKIIDGGLEIVNAHDILGDAHLGDSIAVNGTCLTITELLSSPEGFQVGVAPETLRRTNLGDLKPGSEVNLERAIAGATRFGGHFVQGHVDTTAKIVSREPDGNAITFTFEITDPTTYGDLLLYIVEKGFICIDGTSLTVTHVDDDKFQFSIMLIAYSQTRVVLVGKQVGDTVNIEVDLIGKLIHKQIAAQTEKQISSSSAPLRTVIEKLVNDAVDKKLAALSK